MGAEHGHRLHYHGHSVVHRLPAHCKVMALLAFVLCVVATPSAAYPAFAVYALALALAVAASRVPPPFLLKRMVVETPFVVFALLLPFVSAGAQTQVWGIAVSERGLDAAIALLCKGTLGVVASLLLAATTEARDILAGLERLRMPRQLVEIMGFMIRYLDVSTAELARMRTARESRGFQARGPRAWPVLARSGGALFIRSYERGERVHLAMLARGYTGTLPGFAQPGATRADWMVAAVLPLLALLTLAAAWVAT
ncbi:MAG TPA: cobalt ECF transporter T component CbiQ [Nocardioidaceae bacterium]|nr:cobalt ECF transporter T component CbiQ [Nocardioidaceae bacterium]